VYHDESSLEAVHRVFTFFDNTVFYVDTSVAGAVFLEPDHLPALGLSPVVALVFVPRTVGASVSAVFSSSFVRFLASRFLAVPAALVAGSLLIATRFGALRGDVGARTTTLGRRRAA
jgi:hypothetical protein